MVLVVTSENNMIMEIIIIMNERTNELNERAKQKSNIFAYSILLVIENKQKTKTKPKKN